MHPGGTSAAEYGCQPEEGEGTERPMTRAMMLAGVPLVPWLA